MSHPKTILLAISTTHGISKLIERNLKKYGFEVILLSDYNEKEERFKYPSLWQRLIVSFKRNILRDKSAKRKLQSALLQKELEVKLKQKLGDRKIDYSLFFLAQNFSIELVEFIKGKTISGNFINYQWDGIDRYPRIWEYVKFFDRFFVFDGGDLTKNEQFLPNTSFYFDEDLAPLNEKFDFYFIGANVENRRDKVVKFAQLAQQKDWKLNFQIYCEKGLAEAKNYYSENIHLFDKSGLKGYEHNLLNARQAKVLVDFVDAAHNGLSLRTFEALGHNKKLITTNKTIKHYDFYHPNNIFILEDNFEEIEAFLVKPYAPIDEQIKQKYSFGNWINYVLDIPPYQPILLPKEE